MRRLWDKHGELIAVIGLVFLMIPALIYQAAHDDCVRRECATGTVVTYGPNGAQTGTSTTCVCVERRAKDAGAD